MRRGRSVGLLTDGFAIAPFATSVIGGMRDGAVVSGAGCEIRFAATEHFDLDANGAPEWLAAEQSNSTMIVGRAAVLKLLRKVSPGVHPDVEMVRYLTGNGYENVPPVLGTVTRCENDEETLLMLAQAFVYNQGDGWQWTLGVLERLFSDTDWTFSNYRNFAFNLGRRLAEMHAVLAQATDDQAFAPEPVTGADTEKLRDRLIRQLDEVIDRLHEPSFESLQSHLARLLTDNRDRMVDRINAVAQSAAGRVRTRIHGDLHLGQVLVTGSDVMFIDFEGEPRRSISERRAKDLPLRDVAGMIRSFDYAAAVAERSRPAGADTWGAQAEASAEMFREHAVKSFLAGYHGLEQAEAAIDEPLAPDPLLDLFVMEKAAYEVMYESANRPDWIDVPAAGLARVVAALLSQEAP